MSLWPARWGGSRQNNHPPSSSSSFVWEWAIDSSGVITASTPESYNVVGYRRDELIGRDCSVILDESELFRIRQTVQGLVGAAPTLSEVVVAARHRSGRSVWLEVSGRPQFGSDGLVDGFVGSARMLAAGDAEVQSYDRSRAKIESILEHRLLMTAFQPIVALTTGTVIGVEALTRFVAEPAVTPDVWFAEAAAIGLGIRLELLAVEIALATASQLPQHLYVSINVSPATCLHPGLAKAIVGCPLAPGRIVLELTEHSPVVDYIVLRAALADLRVRGIRMAVDDAGAGFASFRHILQLRPELIKLDRGIIADLGTDPARDALGAAMVSFAAEIGASVIAEGIETPTELQAATDLRMAAGQGFLLGRPTVQPAEWSSWGSPTTAPPPAGPAESPLRLSQFEAPVPDTLSVLDALPDAAAILDHAGRITAVNRIWRMFALDNAGRPGTAGVGVNYLEICRQSAAAGDPAAALTVAGLQAVLAGESVQFEQEYRCDSPEVVRLFLARITSTGPSLGGAVVSHLNVTRRARAEQQLLGHAFHDPLTGLANLLLLREDLSRALAEGAAGSSGCGVGILFVVLDDFHQVINKYGYDAADELLLVTTDRMRQLLRPPDTFARLAGGEFAVCVPAINPVELTEMATNMREMLSTEHHLHGREVLIGSSVGSYFAACGSSADDALEFAERAISDARHGHLASGAY